jgi:hypothetical protein
MPYLIIDPLTKDIIKATDTEICMRVGTNENMTMRQIRH